MIKTCKYGHGELERINGRWALTEYEKLSEPKPTNPDEFLVRNSPTGMIYTLHIYQCPACGYVELFDEEAP